MQGSKLTAAFTLALVEMTNLSSLEAQPRKDLFDVTVGIANIVAAPSGVIKHAQEVANRVLHSAGVTAQWVSCPGPGMGIKDYPDCPLHLSPSHVVIKFGHPFERKDGFRITHFAFTTGFQVTIIYEQVEQAALKAEIAAGSVLGMIMAHEIGHVLLGDDSHSSTGVMRPQWRPKDFVHGSPADFRFTSGQVKQIHAVLEKEALEIAAR
jgi:hypothetical protein